MIKIEHTKTYTLQETNIGNVERLVTDGELVLVETYDSFGKNGGKWIEVNGRLKKPILISRTEKIQECDRYLHSNAMHNSLSQGILFTADDVFDERNNPNIILTGDGIIPYNNYKVLALPEHFSPQQLQMIVDGKLKEGKCLVECEKIRRFLDFSDDSKHQEFLYTIKLDPHITIYPSIEEKMYTREEVKKIVLAYKAQPYLNGEKFEEWFEQNVK